MSLGQEAYPGRETSFDGRLWLGGGSEYGE